jgi:UDP-sulfoquinovose synthase
VNRILILGGDGYLGWPTAMHFSRRGHRVGIVDDFTRRRCHLERGTDSLTPIAPLHERVEAWEQVSGETIEYRVFDLCDYARLRETIAEFAPDTIVHYGEIPSAPYSMIDRDHAVRTQIPNVLGTLNLLWAMREVAPEAHLVKLGTMGEYGTPNIDIEEGYLEIEHNGRRDRLPFPKLPPSFYHLSKVHDSHNIHFACRTWGLRATDLNQGVVYGIHTDETQLDDRLLTRFDYDELFGTALNRFCVEAVIGHPITVYGKGHQTRGFLNIRDTLQCVELATLHPAAPGEMRVFNQFTEVFSVLQLAEEVHRAAEHLGYAAQIQHVENPRVEAEEHYYNPTHTGLLDLGLEPRYLSEELIETMLHTIERFKDRVRLHGIAPATRWR